MDKALVVVKHSVAAYNVVKQKYAGSSRKRAGWVLMAWGRRNAATKAAAALALAAACAASRAKEALDAVDAARPLRRAPAPIFDLDGAPASPGPSAIVIDLTGDD